MGEISDIAAITHAATAVAYGLLSVLLIFGWRQRGPGSWLIAACLATAVWAIYLSISHWTGIVAPGLGRVLETLHLGVWIGFLVSMIRLAWEPVGRASFVLMISRGVLVLTLGLMAIDAVSGIRPSPENYLSGFGVASVIGRLIMVTVAMLLVENLYRSATPNERWRLRHLAIAMAALFGFDFYLYADALLLKRIDPLLLEIRGITMVVLMPLIASAAARNKKWAVEVFVSKQAVFYTTSLMAGGAYLLLMAGVGYYLREVGGRWGTVLQFSFLFGAVIVLLVILLSGQFRSRLRVMLGKHFFSYRYDYRTEWLRFITTISADNAVGDLYQRIIQAVADIADSTGGGLWLHDPGHHYRLAALRNYHPESSGAERAGGAFAQFLGHKRWVLDLDEYRRNPAKYQGYHPPDWLLSLKQGWLVLPLVHRGRLIGFLVLARARAPRDLNWEDLDILKTASSQAASYLAEQAAQHALLQARQFESFNRRFAFVLHDIKNLVSQLSLLVRNADKFGDNPEFRTDMVETIRQAIGKMTRLLERLGPAGNEKGEEGEVDLPAVLKEAVAACSAGEGDIICQLGDKTMPVAADCDRLVSVFGHLIQNAIDATPEGRRVEVYLQRDVNEAHIRIVDEGSGMDADFIENHLFEPFRSTKEAGFGIGAFESKQVITELGGRLEVESTPDEGTTMHIHLPLQEVTGPRETE